MKERANLQDISLIVIIEYIRQSVEILLSIKSEENINRHKLERDKGKKLNDEFVKISVRNDKAYQEKQEALGLGLNSRSKRRSTSSCSTLSS